MTGEEREAPGEGANGQQLGGDTQLEGEGEIEAERKGNDDGEGELQTEGDDGEMKGDKGETEQQEFRAENQGEAESDEKGTGGEEGSDGDDGEDEEDEEEDDEEEDGEEEEDEENEQPLSLEWPETRQKQAIYLFLLPIAFPLWLTVPDVRRLVSWPSCIPGFVSPGGRLWSLSALPHKRRERTGQPAWQGSTAERVSGGIFSSGGAHAARGAYRWAWGAPDGAYFHHYKQCEPVPLDSSLSILILIWE